MKDLGAANFILRMEIRKDRANKMIVLNQRKYVDTVLQRFSMQESKPVKVPILVGVKLSVEQCPKTHEEEEDMSRVPYASAVGSLMYAMVCTRPDISHAVGVSQLLMIYMCIHICWLCWAWTLKHMIDEMFCVGHGPRST